MLVDDAVACRAGGTDEKGWKMFLAAHAPDTREIDPDVMPATTTTKSAAVKRKGRRMTDEELKAALED